jgi:hypothetical protein
MLLLLLPPCRAHYSSGQVHALQHQWRQSEEHYLQCAQLAADAASKGQALYCAGVAAHHLGKFQEALDAYNQAVGVVSIQPMVILGQVRALNALGQTEQAGVVATAFLNSDQARACPAAVLDALRSLNQDR